MRERSKHWLLLPLAILLSGCMPSDADIGRMALLSAPFWFGMGWLALAMLLPMWTDILRTRGIELRVATRASIVVAIVLGLGAVLGGATMTADGWSWFWGEKGTYGFLAVLVGCGFVTVALVVWRVWLATAPASSFTWALIPVIVIFWLPGLLLALSGEPTSTGGFLVSLYTLALFPGFYGIPTIIVLIGLASEASVRRRRAIEAVATDPVTEAAAKKEGSARP